MSPTINMVVPCPSRLALVDLDAWAWDQRRANRNAASFARYRLSAGLPAAPLTHDIELPPMYRTNAHAIRRALVAVDSWARSRGAWHGGTVFT